MIHVDRDSVAVPISFRSGFFAPYEERAAIYFSARPELRRQMRYEFLPSMDYPRDVHDALIRLFKGKCAYCETLLSRSSGGGGLEHFRPRSQAKGLEGVSPDHYWWLAYEWRNLYLACSRCTARKESQFLVQGDRASPGTPIGDLQEERLILDPCEDSPELEMRIEIDGTYWGLTERATVTIETLGLNRPDLREDRVRAMEDVTGHVTRLGGMRDWDMLVAEMISPELEFLAARRATVERIRRGSSSNRDRISVPPPEPEVVPRVDATAVDAPADRLRAQYITHVELKNFRAVRSLSLSLPEPESERAGWKVLLGENGTGKSTVLQAIAIALAGRERVEQLRLHGGDLLPNPRVRGRPVSRGSISLRLFGESDPIEVTFTKDGIEFGGGARVATLVRAYGATRLFDRDAAPDGQGGQEPVRVGNLFDPYMTVCNAERWLLTASDEMFDAAALALKDLLSLDAESILVRTPEDRPTQLWFVEKGGGRVRLEQLSDGYRSVIALAIDLIAANPEQVTDFTAATGIVLVDELGTHLHPRWRMEIVEALRRTFPRIQFICTTHEPLCLRGVDAPEVGIVSRTDEGVAVGSTTISPSALRVDQLLTSPLFGLNTTIDPRTERKFNRYYALLAKKELSGDEQAERERLRTELSTKGTLGYTRRDQMIYEIIDEYLSKEPGLTEEEKLVLLPRTKEKVKKLWRSIEQFRSER